MLIEQLQYNMLFRWFVGMEMDEVVWNHAVYSKNRERLLNEEIAESFFQRVLERAKPYMSDEHFTVDGTLIEAWRVRRAFGGRTERGSHPDQAERSTFTRRSGRTRPTNRPPIPTLDCSRSPKGAKQSSATWDMY
jgi:hypothetical protein